MPNSVMHRIKPQVSTEFLHLIILFVSVMAVYSNCVGNGFVWDDKIFFIGNTNYRNFDISHILFSRANGVEYLPVRDLTYAMDYAIWGENPFGFHATNLAIFLLTLFVLYRFAADLIMYLRQRAPSSDSALTRHGPFLVTLLFAVHPVQAQAVNFITCRNVLVSGLFFFLSLSAFLKFMQKTESGTAWGYYALSLVSFLLALLSKATVISLPLILVLLVLDSGRVRKTLLSTVPFFALSASFFVLFRYIAITEKVIRQDSYDFGSLNPWITLAKIIQIPFFYLYKILVPVNYAAEYEVNFIKSFAHPIVILLAALLLAAFWTTGKLREKGKTVLFGLCWYLAMLLPVLNFYPTTPVVADRYLYLPFFGIVFAIVSGLEFLFGKRNEKRLLLAGCLTALLLSLITRQQNAVWETDLSLWKHAVAVSPNDSKSYANLGYVYVEKKQYEVAYGYFKKAQELDPAKPDFEYIHGAVSYNRGEYQKAIEWFQQALFRKPGYLPALFYLGISYDKRGESKKAIEALKGVFSSAEPDLKQYRQRTAHYLHSIAWPQIEPDIQKLEQARRAKPGPQATAEMADVLFQYGMYDGALALYADAGKAGLNSLQTWRNRAAINLVQGRLEEARNCYINGLTIDGSDAATLNGLGEVYKKMHRYGRAKSAFKAAIARQPVYTDALFNLAVLYFQLGDKSNAINCFEQVDNIAPASYNTAPYVRKMSSAIL